MVKSHSLWQKMFQKTNKKRENKEVKKKAGRWQVEIETKNSKKTRYSTAIKLVTCTVSAVAVRCDERSYWRITKVVFWIYTQHLTITSTFIFKAAVIDIAKILMYQPESEAPIGVTEHNSNFKLIVLLSGPQFNCFGSLSSSHEPYSHCHYSTSLSVRKLQRRNGRQQKRSFTGYCSK